MYRMQKYVSRFHKTEHKIDMTERQEFNKNAALKIS